MYKMIYDIYFRIKRKEKKNKETQKAPSKMIMRILGRIEWYYNIIVKKKYIKDCNSQNKKLGINTKKRKEKIIVSLTSYPKRINVVWITIETLLQQTVKPDEVILWLADSQFKEIEELPEELKALQKRGLTIRFCDDLKSHKKYFYVLQEHKNDLVILTDDDMFYPKDMIERLLKLHEKYPKDICTMTGQVITPSFDSKPSEWRNPKSEEKFIHSDQIQIFTGSGSLYPPNSLSKEVFNKELIKELCPYADDLWLTFMAHRKGTKVTAEFPWRAFPITIYGTGEASLYYINAEGGQNDEQWIKLLNHFEKGQK